MSGVAFGLTGAQLAILGGGALAGGGAALGGFFGRPGEQETGFDVFTPETFPGFETLQGTNIAFLQQELERIRKGEAPSFLSGPTERIREGQQSRLQDRFFGRPGDRSGSLLNRTLELSSILGTGPGAGVAGGRKVLQDFSSESQQIDNFIDQLTLQNTLGSTQQVLGGIQGQQAGPPQVVIPFGGGAVQTGGSSGIAQAGSAFGGAVAAAGQQGQQQSSIDQLLQQFNALSQSQVGSGTSASTVQGGFGLNTSTTPLQAIFPLTSQLTPNF